MAKRTCLLQLGCFAQLSFARIKRKLSKEKSPLWEISGEKGLCLGVEVVCVWKNE
jgi:hypothetical protein